jgi:triphosphoribosyl-dephospho-CoA synthetase
MFLAAMMASCPWCRACASAARRSERSMYLFSTRSRDSAACCDACRHMGRRGVSDWLLQDLNVSPGKRDGRDRVKGDDDGD